MADDPQSVEVTIRVPRELAEYAVRIMHKLDPAAPVELRRADGSPGAYWSSFEVIARASVLEVIASEQQKRDPRWIAMREEELEEICPTCPLRHGDGV